MHAMSKNYNFLQKYKELFKNTKFFFYFCIMMRKIVLYTIAFMALFAVSCGSKDETATKQVTDKKESVRIGVMPSFDCFPFFIAEEQGLFEKDGMSVKLDMFTAQMDVDTALIGGSVDLAITDKYRVEQLRNRGVELKEWQQSETKWMLVANKRSRLNKIDQFAGKMVGMTRFSATANLCEEVFKSLGENTPYYIQINDIQVRANMLTNAELDAAWLPEPQATMAVSKGCNIVRVENMPTGMGEFVYRVKGRYDANKGKKLLKVYNNACDSINKNGLNAYSAEMKKYYDADEKTISKLASYKFKKL